MTFQAEVLLLLATKLQDRRKFFCDNGTNTVLYKIDSEKFTCQCMNPLHINGDVICHVHMVRSSSIYQLVDRNVLSSTLLARQYHLYRLILHVVWITFCSLRSSTQSLTVQDALFPRRVKPTYHQTCKTYESSSLRPGASRNW